MVVGVGRYTFRLVGCGGIAAMLLCGPSTFPAFADTGKAELVVGFRQRVWREKDGLPRDQCYLTSETPDGYLWISNRDGLVRFDGRRMHVFNHSNLPELPSETVYELHATDEFVWFTGPEVGAVYRLSRSGRFKRFSITGVDGPPKILQFKGAEGGVWVGTEEGLCRLKGDQIQSWTLQDGLLDANVLALEAKGEGSLWVGTGAGLQLFEADRGFSEEIPLAGRFGRAIDGLAEGDAGVLWIVSGDEVYRLPDPGRAAAVHWGGDLDWGRGSRMWMLPEGDESLLVPSRSEGLARFVNGVRVDDSSVVEGVEMGALFGMHDREGNLWIATEKQGLVCRTPSSFSSLHIDGSPLVDNAWVVTQTSTGDVWIGTDGGVHRQTGDQIESFDTDDCKALEQIRAIVEGADGSIWIASGGQGMARYFAGVFDYVELPGGAVGNKVRTMLADPDGSLWIGSETGLHHWRNHEVRTLTARDGLSHQDVWGLHRDSNEKLWIGTYGGGLNVMTVDGRYLISPADGFPSLFAWTFHEEEDGTLWIGTPNGLVRHRNGRFASVASKNGLPDDVVNRILADDQGNFWIGSDTGVYAVKRDELNRVADGLTERLTCVVFGESDGMTAAETNGQKSYPAGCRTADGRLWFPTVRGVAVIDPAEVDLSEGRIPVIVESLRANGRVVLRNDFVGETETSEVRHSLELEDENGEGALVHLSAGTVVLEFHFTGICLTAPETVEYRHRVVGFDDDWIEGGDRQTAFYTNLSPGDYRFEVRAGKKGGSWTGPVATLSFVIAHRFYETFTFLAASVISVLAMAVAGYRWRVGELNRFRTLQEEKRALEERARMARDLHDGLGSGLTNLHMLCEQVDRDLARPEVAESYAREISRRTKELAVSLREMIWLSRSESASLNSLVEQLTAYCRKTLGTAKIRCREEIEMPPSQKLSHEVARNVYFAVKESINNVIKHSNAAEVRLTGECVPGGYVFAVHDSGEWKKPSEASSPSGFATGNGMENMRARLAGVGGSFSVQANRGCGTSCFFTIPISVGEKD